MKSLILSMSLMGATGLAASAQAAEAAHPGPRAPATVTAKLRGTVSDYVAAHAHASDVVFYPTAKRNVVFVTYGAESSAAAPRIALVETRGGKVRRFTGFAPVVATASAAAQRPVSSLNGE